jgi:hypothetical protein
MFAHELFDLLFCFNKNNRTLSSLNFIQTLLVNAGLVSSKVHNDDMGGNGGPCLQFVELELQRVFPKTGVQGLVANSLSNLLAARQVVDGKRVASLF